MGDSERLGLGTWISIVGLALAVVASCVGCAMWVNNLKHELRSTKKSVDQLLEVAKELEEHHANRQSLTDEQEQNLTALHRLVNKINREQADLSGDLESASGERERLLGLVSQCIETIDACVQPSRRVDDVGSFSP